MKFIYESRACWNELSNKFWERSGSYSGYKKNNPKVLAVLYSMIFILVMLCDYECKKQYFGEIAYSLSHPKTLKVGHLKIKLIQLKV